MMLRVADVSGQQRATKSARGSGALIASVLVTRRRPRPAPPAEPDRRPSGDRARPRRGLRVLVLRLRANVLARNSDGNRQRGDQGQGKCGRCPRGSHTPAELLRVHIDACHLGSVGQRHPSEPNGGPNASHKTHRAPSTGRACRLPANAVRVRSLNDSGQPGAAFGLMPRRCQGADRKRCG